MQNVKCKMPIERHDTFADMVDVELGLFTVAVFQDVAWARKGLNALKQIGLPAESLTIIAKDSPEAAALIEQMLGSAGVRVEIGSLGPVLARGSLVESLQGSGRDLAKLGLTGAMRRGGVPSHDRPIFETRTGRGGVLVAIRSESRAADALAILHSYGGGNAAIGAWS